MRYMFVVIVLAIAAASYFGPREGVGPVAQAEPAYSSETAIVAIVVPEVLSDEAQRGRALFEENCASCHGPDAVGQVDVAPPLVHVIYEPSHHADESFQRAVSLGVRGHHWPFGNMPAVEGLSRQDVEMIIPYVRELQRANSIN